METKREIGDPSAGLSFIFTMLAVVTWANYMGFFTGPVYLAMGVAQLACYVPYLIGSVLLFQRGDTMNGCIYLIFSTLFGGMGSILNFCYGIAELQGFAICRQMMAFPHFWGALAMVPMMIAERKRASAVTLICHMSAATFLTLMLPASFGILTAVLDPIIHWLNLVVAVTGMYGLINLLLAAGGSRTLPEGQPLFR